MKIQINDNYDYVEIKEDGFGNANLAIKTKNNDKSNLVITANLDYDTLEKLITNMILIKSRLSLEKQK